MHTAPTFPHPTGSEYTTFEELEQAYPDAEVQFKRYAESIGFPAGAWTDNEKKLWSNVAVDLANGRPIRDIATNIKFNPHGKQPAPELLKKVHPHVQNAVGYYNKVDSRVWFRSMLDCDWWIHGDHIISDTPFSVLAWATAFNADRQVGMGNDPTEMLGGFAPAKRRGRPPMPKADKADKSAKAALYNQYVAHCISLRTQRAALSETHHNQLSALRFANKMEIDTVVQELQRKHISGMAALQLKQTDEVAALAAPTFAAYKG